MFKEFKEIRYIKLEDNVLSIHYDVDKVLQIQKVGEDVYDMAEFVNFLTHNQIDGEDMSLTALMDLQLRLRRGVIHFISDELKRMKQYIEQRQKPRVIEELDEEIGFPVG